MYTEGKEELAEQLARLLACTAAYKAIAQGYHWNVLGKDFSEYHEFFGELYEDAESAIDPLAESIRKLGFPAPFTLEDFVSLSDISVSPVTNGDPIAMSENLLKINRHIDECVLNAFDAASACREQGIADLLAGRDDMHKKWIWQLSSITGADAMVVKIVEIG